MLKRTTAFAAVFVALFALLAGVALASSNPGEITLKQLVKQMGVPVYPGAKYLEHMGALSQPGQKIYVFESVDKPAKAAGWYKKRLKKQIVKQKRGKDYVYFVPLRGNPAPEDYIMVEPNIYGGKALSIITVVKKTGVKKVRSERSPRR